MTTITRNPREAALEAVVEAAREYRRTPHFTAAREALDDALTTFDALPAADGGWRPIEDEPPDGTDWLVIDKSGWQVGCTFRDGFWWRGDDSGAWLYDRPVAYRELLPPPVPQSAEGEG